MDADSSDEELVAAARAGDKQAFAVLVDRHWPRARALAASLLREEADDVAQEAVLQAFLGLDRLRSPERFGPWLYAIAANIAKMRLRWLAARPQFDGAARPSRGEEAAEITALVREALAVLTPEQREAVLMHDLGGYTAGEIARRVGGSSGAVRVRLHRGRRKLRRQLAGIAPATRKETAMVEVELHDVVVRLAPEGGEDGGPKIVDNQRIVLLRERGGARTLPIWIGAAEGDALALHLGNEATPRPLTADLMARLLEATGGRVERVVVSTLHENTFYGAIHLAARGETREVDSRPSDAINLAVRVGAPMLVEDAVFEQAALPDATPEALDQELAKHADQRNMQMPEGEWRSLSPELVRTVGSFRPWHPSPREERENE